MVIFVSFATISQQEVIEKNTTSVLERFKNFRLFNSLNIPIVLYMKPVLNDITIQDLELFKKYIYQYAIRDVVVGSIFTGNISEETVHFSDKNLLFYTKNDDEDTIISELSKVTNVYRRSSEVMYKYRTNYYKKKYYKKINISADKIIGNYILFLLKICCFLYKKMIFFANNFMLE